MTTTKPVPFLTAEWRHLALVHLGQGCRSKNLVIRVLIVGLVGGAMLAPAKAVFADQFDSVREQIHDLMTAESIPSIAVAVARDGKVLWEEGFGWANLAQRIPATPHTSYSLASISKPITATALMILVERGVIDLDKPIDDYLGQQKLTAPAGSANAATVRRVANHTSGLPLHYQFFYEDESVPLRATDESIRRYGVLTRLPGEGFTYSNFGYGLIEYAIERASGKSYAEFMRDELFVPLGLSESAVNHTPDLGSHVAVRYREGRPIPFYDFDHRAASAVFMSAHDLVRFGMFHLQGELVGQQKTVLQRSTLASMLDKPASIDDKAVNDGKQTWYGIGWRISEEHGLKQLSHSGGMAGVATQLSLYPDANIVVVVLANTEGVHSAEGKIESGIIHALLPETIRRDHGFKPQSELVGSWKGAVHTYAGQAPAELEFKKSGSVFARVGEGPPQEVTEVITR